MTLRRNGGVWANSRAAGRLSDGLHLPK